MSLNTHIQTIGKAEGWILTTDKIKAIVLDAVKDKPLTHFLDLKHLAQSIEIPSKSLAEKQQYILDFSGVAKSDVKEVSKFKKLHNSGNHGNMIAWFLEHPDCTASELHNSGTVTASNKDEYYDEVLAYRELFSELYKFDYNKPLED